MQRVWARELAGWAGALAVAIITAAQVAASPRAELLFRDGDSLVVAMISRSLLSGSASDWAMSSVLFLPESAVFTALDAVLPVDIGVLFAIHAVLNMLALYGAVRLVAGRRLAGRSPVTWSLATVGAFGVLAATETSASRDALEPASLLLTTTYYWATVVAAIVTVGLVRRAIDRRHRSAAGLLILLGATAAVSTLSNPLYVAWATVPLSLVLVALASTSALRRRLLTASGVLVGATILGFVCRIPFAAWIANTGAGYIRPTQWLDSVGYYLGLALDRLASPTGILAAALSLALCVFAVVLTVRAEDAGRRFVAAAAWVTPALVLVGAIALGTNAARYLQPIGFAPLLVLVADARTPHLSRHWSRIAAAVVAVALACGAALSAPRLVVAATAPDPDLACVIDWVHASGRTGAGQFWTVRLPKTHLDDPSRLVQVDHALNGYAWLVDRRDFDAGEVSFLVEDAQTVLWDLPVGAAPDAVVSCGRYRILDFASSPLRIGPAHS